jgi:hypothetical protein
LPPQKYDVLRRHLLTDFIALPLQFRSYMLDWNWLEAKKFLRSSPDTGKIRKHFLVNDLDSGPIDTVKYALDPMLLRMVSRQLIGDERRIELRHINFRRFGACSPSTALRCAHGGNCLRQPVATTHQYDEIERLQETSDFLILLPKSPTQLPDMSLHAKQSCRPGVSIAIGLKYSIGIPAPRLCSMSANIELPVRG